MRTSDRTLTSAPCPPKGAGTTYPSRVEAASAASKERHAASSTASAGGPVWIAVRASAWDALPGVEPGPGPGPTIDPDAGPVAEPGPGPGPRLDPDADPATGEPPAALEASFRA